MASVYPTHTCFDDALDLLHDLIDVHPPLIENLRLVHGICLMADDRPYAHAWIEDIERDIVIFVGIHEGDRKNFAAPRTEYLAEMRVQERISYTWAQAFAENHRSNHYGPWVDRYLLLTGPSEGK